MRGAPRSTVTRGDSAWRNASPSFGGGELLLTDVPTMLRPGRLPGACSTGLSDRQTRSASGRKETLRSVWRTPSPTAISRSAPLSTATPCAKCPRIKSLSCSNQNAERPDFHGGAPREFAQLCDGGRAIASCRRPPRTPKRVPSAAFTLSERMQAGKGGGRGEAFAPHGAIRPAKRSRHTLRRARASRIRHTAVYSLLC